MTTYLDVAFTAAESKEMSESFTIEDAVLSAAVLGVSIECPPLGEAIANASLASITGPIAELDVLTGNLARGAAMQATHAIARTTAPLVTAIGIFGKRANAIVDASSEVIKQGFSKVSRGINRGGVYDGSQG